MITVAGFNSALDKYLEVDAIRIGQVARARQMRVLPGGKGAHVALAAAALGERVRLVAAVDARNERWFESFFGTRGVEFYGVRVEGELRTCLAIRDDQGQLTEILEAGPDIGEAAAERLMTAFLEACDGVEVAVLSGSVPPGMRPDTYARLVRSLAQRSTRCVVDTSGECLRLATEARPFAIKPNRPEAEALTGTSLETLERAMDVARRFEAQGIELVMLSLGSAGAVARWSGRTCHVTAPAIPSPANTVGAGDCLVAGLATGLVRGVSQDDVLSLAVACGSAKILCSDTGLLRPEDVTRLAPQVHVSWAS